MTPLFPWPTNTMPLAIVGVEFGVSLPPRALLHATWSVQPEVTLRPTTPAATPVTPGPAVVMYSILSIGDQAATPPTPPLPKESLGAFSVRICRGAALA